MFRSFWLKKIFLFNFDNIEVLMVFKSNIELLSIKYLIGGQKF